MKTSAAGSPSPTGRTGRLVSRPWHCRSIPCNRPYSALRREGLCPDHPCRSPRLGTELLRSQKKPDSTTPLASSIRQSQPEARRAPDMAHGQLAPILHYLRRVTSPVVSGDIPDTELLCRFSRNRDETAFAALVRRHGPMVLAVCRRVLRDGHTAEDAFQATFLVLARKAGSLAKPELLANWLYGVARRTAAKAKTDAAKRRLHERRAVRTPPSDPCDELEWHDLRAVLDEEVSRLPERYRVPVVLCYLQGQTNAEAARRLGCSRGTVATLLARARDKLQRRLTQRGVGLSVGFGLTP